jgi:F-type H+-transporting ATPase subunit gamma
MKIYMDGEVDQVFLLYNEFKSVIQQKIVVERLLPITKLAFDPKAPALDYLYEPARGRSSSASSPGTWSSRCGGRCWSRRRRSTARA